MRAATPPRHGARGSTLIVAGALMESGGISERIVDLAMAIVGRVRGGLAMVAVVAEILFSGISGSTAADISAISSLLVPSMRKAGYSGPESVSVVAAASAMGAGDAVDRVAAWLLGQSGLPAS